MNRLLNQFSSVSIPAADTKRRIQNIRHICLFLLVISGSLLVYSLTIQANLLTQIILLVLALALAAIRNLAQRQHPEVVAWLLIMLLIGGITLEIINSNRFGITPTLLVIVPAISGIMMRPRDVALACLLTLLTLIGLWLGLGEARFDGVAPGILLITNLVIVIITGMVAIVNAITTLRALSIAEQGAISARMTEDALRESEQYYRLIADNARDLIALLDEHGYFLYASPSYARALGYAPITIIGIDAAELIHPDERESARGDFFAVVEGDEVQRTYRVMTSNDEVRWLNTRISIIEDAENRYIAVVARDVTEQRALELQLQHAQKMESLGMLSGSIAHDFNNLITIINASAEFAADDLTENHPVHGDLAQIRAAAQRAADLTRQLLTFARRQPGSPQEIALDHLLLAAQGLIERMLGKQIRLVLQLSDAPPSVLADPGQIEQVLLNMAANARDAMPNGGTLTIRLSNLWIDPLPGSEPNALPGGRYACLQISDSGVGMSETIQRRIFEPFFTTKDPDRGTGLGLATCYGIVTQNGGRISVSSTPGAGSTFEILLPAVMQPIEQSIGM